MNSTFEILERFVLRARRVESHSLAQDREALTAMGSFSITGHIGLDGSMVVRRALPDEEVFESLAARVRPVLVKTESIYYEKVLTAINECVDAAGVPMNPDDTIRLALAQLAKDWSHIDLDSANVVGFAVQSASVDGSDATPQVSDTQLAAAWLYGDLVHVDTRGKKSDGLLFSVKERFAAAATYFAHVAALVLATLDVLKRLAELGVVELGDRALTEDVVVAAEELVDETTAFVGPADAPMPDLGTTRGELPAGFKQFTVTELLRQDPSNHVEVVLEDSAGSLVETYEAAVNNRHLVDGRLHWHVLLENVSEFGVSVRVDGDAPDDIRFETMVSHASTNQMMLADVALRQQMARSANMTFVVSGQPFFKVALPLVSEKDCKFIDISADTLLDLVLIERLVGRQLTPLAGTYSHQDRVRLRRARLLWQGELVQYASGPLEVTVRAGVVPPAIEIREKSFQLGDVEVPYPGTLLRHPRAFVTSTNAIPNSDPPLEQLVVQAPDGEVFIAWAPSKRQVVLEDDLSECAPWDLFHLDEDKYLSTK